MKKLTSKRLDVRVGNASYPIIVGVDLEKELLSVVQKESCSRIAVITDTTVRRLWGAQLVHTLKRANKPVALFSFPSGERNKNQKTVTSLQHQLLKKRFGRDSLIVAVGGGVTGDMAGFVAATYLRGVPYVQVPTTLLAMVDSSIGGKVGIDTHYGKNTVGAFWQPRAVIADLRFLKELPRTQLISGLLEAVKTFFTSDARALVTAQKLDLDNPLQTAKILQAIVFRSISIKAAIVERDERERNERKVVNFGHTIGHAIELLSGFKMPHGYAVGYGMLVEAKVSELLRILPSGQFELIGSYLKRLGVTTKALVRFSAARVLRVAKADKKTRGGKIHYILLARVGSVYKKAGQYAHPVKDRVVKKALRILTGK